MICKADNARFQIASALTNTFTCWMHLALLSNVTIESQPSVAQDGSRPGDVAFRRDHTADRLLIDHSVTFVLSPSHHQPAGLHRSGHLAANRELQKYEKYSKLLGHNQAQCQTVVDALSEKPIPFLAQPLAHGP